MPALVAAVHGLFFDPNDERVCFPSGKPVRVVHYRILNQMSLPLRAFPRGLDAARRSAFDASLPDPASFPGGEDSYHPHTRTGGLVHPDELREPTEGRTLGVHCELSPERVDLLDSAGGFSGVRLHHYESGVVDARSAPGVF